MLARLAVGYEIMGMFSPVLSTTSVDIWHENCGHLIIFGREYFL